jgi:hypothetical protein
MRTMLFIAGGLVLLGIFLVIGRNAGSGGATGMVGAAKLFLPVWLAVALYNMWMGVAKAGYPVGEELPIMLLIFAVPAAAAGFVWWKYS